MNKWIPVTEKLPRDGENVLISIKRGHVQFASDETDYISIASRNIGIWLITDSADGEFLNDDCVSAWMPLPKPYEG